MSESNEIIDLQSRLAFQEDLLQESGRQIALLAGELRDSQLQIIELSKRIAQLEEAVDLQRASGGADEVPPHY